jgi:acetyltransferase-like isoleucine patch superfamily enzyme
MTVQIVDNGRNNRVDIDPAFIAEQAGTIVLEGDGNHVRIGPDCRLAPPALISLQNGSSFSAGSNCSLNALRVQANHASTIVLGDFVAFSGQTFLLSPESGGIQIGNVCLFAGGTQTMNSDMHPIWDRGTGERINPMRDVSIGQRVWVGLNTIIAKGSRIGSGSVIGAMSMVTGDIPEMSWRWAPPPGRYDAISCGSTPSPSTRRPSRLAKPGQRAPRPCLREVAESSSRLSGRRAWRHQRPEREARCRSGWRSRPGRGGR